MRSGSLLLSHGAWYLKLYVGGKQRAYRLGPKRQFQTKREVRLAADRKMLELRLVDAGSSGRMTLEQFIRVWMLPVCDGELRQSTAKGYRGLYSRYVAGRAEAKRPLWEFKTRDVQNLLYSIAADRNLSKETLKHIKAFLSGAFRRAVIAGFREGNPVHDTIVPKSSKPSKMPGVYTLEEVTKALGALHGAPLAAVAIAAFAGLRLAEIQALETGDYDGEALSVNQTQWRGYVNDPKSKASKSWVPVVPPLKLILDAYIATLPANRTKHDEDGNRVPDTSLFPVSTRGGGNKPPNDLDHMGRRIVARALKSVGVEWKGWHSFRRGLASTLFELGCPDIVVQRILRHQNVAITQARYIRIRDPKVTDAMNRLNNALTSSGQEAGDEQPVARHW